MRVLRHLLQRAHVQVQPAFAAQALIHQLRPGILLVPVSKERGIAAQLHRQLVHVIHKLIDHGKGDLLHLGFGVGHLAHQDVTGGINASFSVCIQHNVSLLNQGV